MKVKQVCTSLAVAGATTLMTAAPGFCAVDLTGVILDTTTPETLAATVLGGLAVVWGIRKVIKLINRS